MELVEWWCDLSPFWKWGGPIAILAIFGLIFLASGHLFLFPVVVAVLLLLVNFSNVGKGDSGW